MVNLTKTLPGPDCLKEEKQKSNGDYKCGNVLTQLKSDFHNKYNKSNFYKNMKIKRKQKHMKKASAGQKGITKRHSAEDQRMKKLTKTLKSF